MVGEDEGAATSDEASLRPLSACVAGLGVMTLGVLQFVGNVWSDVPDAARLEMLVVTRIGFMGFMLALAALVLAWIARKVAGPWWMGAANLYGLLVFTGTALIVTSGLGKALASASLQEEQLPSEAAFFLIGAGIAVLILMALSLPVLFVVHYLRSRNP